MAVKKKKIIKKIKKRNMTKDRKFEIGKPILELKNISFERKNIVPVIANSFTGSVPLNFLTSTRLTLPSSSQLTQEYASGCK